MLTVIKMLGGGLCGRVCFFVVGLASFHAVASAQATVVINSVIPGRACPGDIVTVRGDDLDKNNSNYDFKIGTTTIIPNVLSNTEVELQVPSPFSLFDSVVVSVTEDPSGSAPAFTVVDSVFIPREPEVDYPMGPFCLLDNAPIVPQISLYSALSFTISSPLAIHPTDGTVYPFGATASNSYFVQWTDNSSCVYAGSTSILFEAPTASQLSYPINSICINGPSVSYPPSPAGPPGASYSVFPPGLNIDTITGAITPHNSVPDSYVITYHPPLDSCQLPSQFPLDVLWDQVNFDYGVTNVCDTIGILSPTITYGPFGGTYSSSPTLPPAALDPITGEFDTQHASVIAGTTYTVYYTAPNCSQPFAATNGITVQHATQSVVSYPSNYCRHDQNLSPTIFFPTTGTYSWGSPLNAIDPNTGEIDMAIATAGNYAITYSGDGCILPSPPITVTIEEVTFPYDYAPDSLCGCLGTFPGPNPLPAGSSFPANLNTLNINATTGEITLGQTGTFPIVMRINNGACDVIDTIDTVTLYNEAPAPISYPARHYCTDGPLVPPQQSIGSDIISSSSPNLVLLAGGIIDPTASTSGGPYTVTRLGNDACACSDTFQVWIRDRDIVSFQYIDTSYCTNADPQAPIFDNGANQTGVFSTSIGGLEIDSVTGFINFGPSFPGEYVIYYSTQNSSLCWNSDSTDLKVLLAPNAEFSYDTTLICNDTAFIDVRVQPGSLGFYTADPPTLDIDTLTGRIFTATSPEGDYDITYSIDLNSCSASHLQTITVEHKDLTTSIRYPYPVITPNYFCPQDTVIEVDFPNGPGDLGGTFELNPPVPGGIIYSTGELIIGQLDTTIRDYTILHYDYSNCWDTTSYDVVLEKLDPTFVEFEEEAYCLNGNDPQASFTPVGGIFDISGSSAAGVIDSNGRIDLASSEPGFYDITYSTNVTCPNTNQTTIRLKPSPNRDSLAFTTVPEKPCETETVQIFLTRTDSQLVFNHSLILDADTFFLSEPNLQTDTLEIGEGFEIGFGAEGCWEYLYVNPGLHEIPKVTRDTSDEIDPENLTVCAGINDVALKLTSDTDQSFFFWEAYSYDIDSLGAGETTTPEDSGIVATIFPKVGAIPEYHPELLTFYYYAVANECKSAVGTAKFLIPPTGNQVDIFIPGVITPNGDLKNDTWLIRWDKNLNPEDFTMHVINRAGGIVHSFSPIVSNWDGGNLPDGVYRYILKRNADGKVEDKGALTIRRNPSID